MKRVRNKALVKLIVKDVFPDGGVLLEILWFPGNQRWEQEVKKGDTIELDGRGGEGYPEFDN